MGLFSFTEEAHLAAAGKLPGTELTEDGKTKKRVRIKVFKNDFLEKWFGTAHPATPGIWLPVVAAGLYKGITGSQGTAKTLGLFAGGVALVSLTEYVVHRFLFHQVPKTHEDQMNHFIMHGYHHDFPNDDKRLVFPLAFILPTAAAFAGTYKLALGDDWLQLFAGTAMGYILYDWTHYYTHHFRPKSGVGKWLMQYHILHHHDSPNHRFGISSPIWDLVFGTYLPTDQHVKEKMKDRARQGLEADGENAEPSTASREAEMNAQSPSASD